MSARLHNTQVHQKPQEGKKNRIVIKDGIPKVGAHRRLRIHYKIRRTTTKTKQALEYNVSSHHHHHRQSRETLLNYKYRSSSSIDKLYLRLHYVLLLLLYQVLLKLHLLLLREHYEYTSCCVLPLVVSTLSHGVKFSPFRRRVV